MPRNIIDGQDLPGAISAAGGGGANAFGGTGALGDVMISGSTLMGGVLNYASLTIESPSGQLEANPEEFLLIRCTGDLTNNNEILADQKGPLNYNGLGGAGAGGHQVGGTGGVAGNSSYDGNTPGGLVGVGAGASGAPGNVTPAYVAQKYAEGSEPYFFGSSGGSGGEATFPTAGGRGGGCVVIEAVGDVVVGTINAFAQGGANGTGDMDGGGGGANGGLVIIRHGGSLTAGIVSVLGGNGGTGNNGGGSGGVGRDGLFLTVQV